MPRRQPAPGPASARTLHRALEALGAAPRADPALRPRGAREEDAALLLGILLAKVELDAAVRADPGLEPPDGLAALVSGYRAMTVDQRAEGEELLWRLLSLRLIRTASESSTFASHPDELLDAAANAAMAAANLLNAKFADHGTDGTSPSDQALESAVAFSSDAHTTAAHTLGRQAVAALTEAESLPPNTSTRRPISPMARQCVAAYLDTLTREQLRHIAARCGRRGYSTMNREQLRTFLLDRAAAAARTGARKVT
ncbi:hypothetical protein [Streptomyces sp. JJ38]|uniref:hypothetical protein n=1 Tax=Streptomyces sp. JJ38 TaxID=2738128 RepID=UPI001C582591|nr:hypothetical protein [Streptomyces sp. JJ38]MBW1597248.1 hypothetical protein [Streptomyces sp. JJ38]